MALTFRGVDHFSLTVTDLNVSAKFYTEVLGWVGSCSADASGELI
jgi:hypothetical protein